MALKQEPGQARERVSRSCLTYSRDFTYVCLRSPGAGRTGQTCETGRALRKPGPGSPETTWLSVFPAAGHGSGPGRPLSFSLCHAGETRRWRETVETPRTWRRAGRVSTARQPSRSIGIRGRIDAGGFWRPGLRSRKGQTPGSAAGRAWRARCPGGWRPGPCSRLPRPALFPGRLPSPACAAS